VTQIIDMHVHIVGNGRRGSGCWLRPTGLQRWLGRFMLRHLRINVAGFDDPEFDDLYLERLLDWVHTSSLDAVVILAQDEAYDKTGQKLGGGTFYVPNQYVLDLARQHSDLLPAVSIHPARADAFDELDRCLDAGAVMLKILPNCHNIDCNDRWYQKFWERLAAARLPLLAHTGGEHTLRVRRRDLQDPRVLTLPLECGVTCIAAHMAGQSGLFDRDYHDVLVEMMSRYPKLYGDISALNIPFRSKHLRRCLESPLVERVVHGSDYPVPVHGHWAKLRDLIDHETLRRWQDQPNLLERDYKLKRAIGFPEEVFTRVGSLLRR
jgi:uncharacterized protein